MAICTKCNKDKPRRAFHRDRSRKSGLQTRCKVCQREYMREYRARPEFAEEQRARNRAYIEERHCDPVKRKAWNERFHAHNARRRTRITGAGGSYNKRQFKALCKRHKWRCVRCGGREGELDRNGSIIVLAGDHIIPVAMGGTSNIDNIQPLCDLCNSIKGVQTIDYR